LGLRTDCVLPRAASKWIFPWAELVAGSENPDYKSTAQAWWSVGAVLGSFFGAQLASLIGRRLAYFLISLGSTAITCGLFLFTKPMQPIFLPLLFAQGFIATLHIRQARLITRLRDVHLAFRALTTAFLGAACATPTPATTPATTAGCAFRAIRRFLGDR
jgi:MFS family permease